MFTRTIKSGTDKFPRPKDVFLNLLTRLIEGDHQQGWAHFEWRKKLKWYQISHMPPAVEVALLDDAMLTLNFGLPSNIKDPAKHCASQGIPIRQSWTMSKDMCEIPISELPLLIDWIDEYFVKVHGAPPDYQVRGYLDGI